MDTLNHYGMYVLLLSCSWILSVCRLGSCSLQWKFKEFAELSADNFTVVVKRDSMSGRLHLKIVTFSVLQKYFVLHLYPGSPVLLQDVVATAVDGDGRITHLPVDQQIFYTGYLNGNPKHGVDATYTDGIWLAQIHGPDDVYSIEPLTHHIPDSSATSMLVFRQRDIADLTNNGPHNKSGPVRSFCEEVRFQHYPSAKSTKVMLTHPSSINGTPKTKQHKRTSRQSEEDGGKHITNSSLEETSHSRQDSSKDGYFEKPNSKHNGPWKRSGNNGNYPLYDTCEMMVIADFESFKGIGRRNIFRMISILVYLYQSVDRIYRETHFGSFTNFGISVAKIVVHTHYTNITNHYNVADNKMTGINTLYAMAAISNFSNYCLVHLTTQRNFAGTLGIATTAEKRSDVWGNGICARYLRDARNVGVSTPVTAGGEILPVIMYLLVIAHEIGHNWGSHHDPTDDPLCSPASDKGGKYIMWAYSGQTPSLNAKKFSPCSRTEMAKALHAKAHLCFMARNVAERNCGNNVRDPEEDCDTGYLKSDSCCMQNCKLRENAVCSPSSEPCCTESCQIAPATQKCFTDMHDCHETSVCSGTDARACPESKLLPNNSTCQSMGKCWYGECVSFCELLGVNSVPARRLVECTCDEDRQSMCVHCCWDSQRHDGCIQMGGVKSNGTPCLFGICQAGVCVTPKDANDFLSDDSSQFSSRSNRPHVAMVILTVLFLSLWIFVLREKKIISMTLAL